MPDQSVTNSGAVDVDLTNEDVDVQDGSRRGFLKLGAVVAAGFVEACSSTPEPVGGSGGTPSNGGATSGGATTTSGGATTLGGSTSSGGTPSSGGSLGSSGASGAAAQGGSAQAGATSTGGVPAGGAGAGNTTGGIPAGGAASGGTSPGGGAGGSGPAGGTSSGGSTGMGGKENNASGCTIGTVPTFATSTANAKFPDPFKMLNGMRITKKEEWNCLRAELSAIVQACIYGPKMPPPDMLTASFSGGKLTVNMTVGSKTGSFSVTISGGGSAASPAPCLITCGGSSLPGLSGVATINMPNNTMAAESKTVASGGLVHTLYGDKASKSGSLIGWAWGLSRIIDGLEKCPEAGIDTKRIAVTGCSRNGKGALAMGAFDERVALTIPQEGGSGGPASWRIAAAEKKMGQNIQESQEIIGEANWQGSDFRQYAPNVDKLPGDQHTVIALCAPRAVLIIENNIDWLGPVACYGAGIGAQAVYEALGIKDRIGVSVPPDHNHCMSVPASQTQYINNFVTRFLKKGTANTGGVDELTTKSTTSKLGKFDKAQWIDWTIPTLSGNLAWDPFA